MKQELRKVIQRIHNKTYKKNPKIKWLNCGSFREVFRYKELVIKKNYGEEEDEVKGDNETELKNYKQIISHKNKNLKHLILPLLGHIKLGKSLYLIYPFVITVARNTEGLTDFQDSMVKDCDEICGDSHYENLGILHNTVMLLDYGTYMHFPSKNYKFNFLKMKTYEKNISQVNSYIKKLKLKYLL